MQQATTKRGQRLWTCCLSLCNDEGKVGCVDFGWQSMCVTCVLIRNIVAEGLVWSGLVFGRERNVGCKSCGWEERGQTKK